MTKTTNERPAKRQGIGEIVTRRLPDGAVVREYYRRDEVVALTKEIKMHGFTFYGTESEAFAVCQGCGMVWLVQREGLVNPRPVDCVPEDAECVDSNEIFFDGDLPGCCDR